MFRKREIMPKALFACRVDTKCRLTIFSADRLAYLTGKEKKQYLSNFRKIFSGELRSNMRILHLPKTEAEQETLPDLFCHCLQNKCTDNGAVESLFAAIAEIFPSALPYYILGMYQDANASNPQIILAVCPMNPSRPFLKKENCFEEFAFLNAIQIPIQYLLYPAFHDENKDLHNIFLCINRQKSVRD